VDNLESMHVMFGSAHVTGASASTHGDLLDNPSDDEVHEVEKSPSDVMFSSLPKKSKKCKASSSHDIKDKREESHFYDCIRIFAARYKKEWTR
jgi:hypothetical protein